MTVGMMVDRFVVEVVVVVLVAMQDLERLYLTNEERGVRGTFC